jgi:phospholipid/cholesterol/gamma-HCH transport system substrate-binding protein
VIDWLGFYKNEIAAFFSLDAASTQVTDIPPGGETPAHYLRTANPLNPENLAVYPRRIPSNRSNPYVEPLGYKNHPLKVFGTYLCTNNPEPQLAPLNPITSLLISPELHDLVQQFAFNSGNGVPAPPCVEQPPLGRLLGQPGKYPHVVRAP